MSTDLRFQPGDLIQAVVDCRSMTGDRIEAGRMYEVTALDRGGWPILATDEHGGGGWAPGQFRGAVVTEVAEVPVALPGWAHHGQCRARRDGRPCPDPAAWSLALDCTQCGALGSGTACDFHKAQAEEWGVPHPDAEDDGQCPQVAHLVSAVRL